MTSFRFNGSLRLLVLSVGLATGSVTVFGQTPVAAQPSEVEALRAQLDLLQAHYEERLATLEARLADLEAREAPASGGADAEHATTAATPGQGGGMDAASPPSGSLATNSQVFNPDIAVIGDVLGAAGTNGLGRSPAFELHEAEVSLQATVDPYAHADMFLSFGPDGVDVEEGFISFPALPGGVLMKAGKLRSAFGKVNTQHNHVLPWGDRPLVTTNLVGGEEGLSDNGVSVSKLLLNPWFFLEATGEVYNGNSAVFTSQRRRDVMYVGHLRGYRDLSDSSNLDLGASMAYGHNDGGPDFSTRLVGVDATFRYRPLRRAIYHRLLARTELIWSRREQVTADASAFGLYAGGDYQFARRWFAGARYDYSERAYDAALHDTGASATLTYWPSEFEQLRGQYRRTRYAEGEIGHEVLIQVLFSIGAHGAHPF